MTQKFLFMNIKPKKTCLVLDLDDTLYKEYDYQTSGLIHIEKQVLRLYGVDITGKLLELRDKGVNDIFLELTTMLDIPSLIKDSFLMMYRYHSPDIHLTVETNDFLKKAIYEFKQVVILTDGRSISQRLKLDSLNLMNIPVFISEEWNSIKPDNKRFIAVMEKYNSCTHFCYVADNPSKDFIAPNTLDWTSICLKGNKNNIHSQVQSKTDSKNLPFFLVSALNDIYAC
jgi:putative hydrolase of the HAD superfamily